MKLVLKYGNWRDFARDTDGNGYYLIEQAEGSDDGPSQTAVNPEAPQPDDQPIGPERP